MTKLRLAGVLTAIALVVGLLASVTTVSAQGVTVITGNVTFNGVSAAAGTSVRAVDGTGAVVAETTTGPTAEFAPEQYRMDVTFGPGSMLLGATLSLQVLSGGTYVPAQGAVTILFQGNVVITQNIETHTVPPSVSSGGAAGAAGADGAAGPRGYRGAPGPAGHAGADGAAGPAGHAGSAGHPGAAGSAGHAGADGAAGPAGHAGSDGGTGPAGAVGPGGEDGGSGLAVVALIIAIIAAVAAGAGVMKAQKK